MIFEPSIILPDPDMEWIVPGPQHFLNYIAIFVYACYCAGGGGRRREKEPPVDPEITPAWRRWGPRGSGSAWNGSSLCSEEVSWNDEQNVKVKFEDRREFPLKTIGKLTHNSKEYASTSEEIS